MGLRQARVDAKRFGSTHFRFRALGEDTQLGLVALVGDCDTIGTDNSLTKSIYPTGADDVGTPFDKRQLNCADPRCVVCLEVMFLNGHFRRFCRAFTLKPRNLR